MRVSLRYGALVALVAAGIASTVAFYHMSSLAGLLVIAPGYLVQAWLFERHWALGGTGYAATLIGVSTVFWTVLLVVTGCVLSYMAHRVRQRRAA
jgi:hypothetical protein